MEEQYEQSEQYGQYIVSPAEVCLNLRCGQPATSYLTNFSKLISTVNFNSDNIGVLQYGKKDGFDSFKKQVVKLMETFSNTPDTPDTYTIPYEHIYMTNGVTQGVQLLTSYLKSGYLTKNKKPVNALYIEELTYFLIKNHLEDIGIPVRTFSFDNLDKLYHEMLMFKKIDDEFAFYLIPFCHNPTGLSLTYDQITRFLSITGDSLVLSDETYLFLHRSDNQKKFKSLYFYSNEDNNIVTLHTFSKIMAPGLRLGYMLTKNTNLLKLLDNGGFMDSGGSVNPFMAYIIKQSLEDNFKGYTNYLNEMKDDLTNKMKFIESQLDKYPEHFSYDKPDGGYFIFFKTKLIIGTNFERYCEKAQLSFHNAGKFGSNSKYTDNYYRISISYYSMEDLEKYFPERLKLLVELIDKKIITLKMEPKVLVLGYKGRLGSLIMKELEKIKHKFYGLDRDFKIDLINTQDIIIDVSSPEGLKYLLENLIKENKFPKIITGTTGNLPTELMESYSKKSVILVKSNFSIGIQTILSMLNNFDKDYWNIEIQETHHTKKKDSPSGTALSLHEELKKITSEIIPIESIRKGDIIGFHSIKLSTPNETIEIRHNVIDRSVFAVGCVKLLEDIQKINTGLYYNNDNPKSPQL